MSGGGELKQEALSEILVADTASDLCAAASDVEDCIEEE